MEHGVRSKLIAGSMAHGAGSKRQTERSNVRRAPTALQHGSLLFLKSTHEAGDHLAFLL